MLIAFYIVLGAKVVLAVLSLLGIRVFQETLDSPRRRALPVRLLFGGRIESWESGLVLCGLLVALLVSALPLLQR